MDPSWELAQAYGFVDEEPDELEQHGGTLGEEWLDEPIEGHWTLDGFPDRVILGGRVFVRARWKRRYVGVLEQYREARARQSAHLMVRADRTWIITHVDEHNPDRGHPIRHLLADHPAGHVLRPIGWIAAGAIVRAVLVAILK